MGLSIKCLNGKTFPSLTCDTCGEPIENIHSAMVGIEDIFIGNSIPSPIYVFHRGECAPGRKVMPGTQELREYMTQLVWNLHLGRIFPGDDGKQYMAIELPEPDMY